MRKSRGSLRGRQATGDVQCPQRTKLRDVTTGRVSRLRLEGRERGRFQRPGGGAFLEQPPCGAHMPLTLVGVQRGEFGVGLCSEIDLGGLVGRRPRHAIETAVRPVPEFVARIVAMLRVHPVNDVSGTVGTVLNIDRHVGRVGRKEQIVARVKRLVGRARAHVYLVIELMPVEIVGEKMVAVGVGPVVAEVNHRADMRVAAVDGGAAGFACAAFAAVVARGSHQVIFQLRRKVRSAIGNERRVAVVRLVPIVTVAHHVARATAAKEAAAMRHEEVAHAVEIEAPLIAPAGRKDFELMTRRMIAPHRRTHGRALGRRCPGLAHQRTGENPMAAVKPAIRAPGETVKRLVRILKTPTIEQDLWRSIGHVVAIRIGNEEQIRRSAHPHAAEPQLESTHEV